MRLISPRGQEEAPFSLLLAVLMLALIIPISARLFEELSRIECSQRIRNNMRDFSTEISLAASLGATSKKVTVDFADYQCAGFSISRFEIVEPNSAYSDSSFCLKRCDSTSCRIMYARGEGDYIIDSIEGVCITLPPNMELTSSACRNKGDYQVKGSDTVGLDSGYFYDFELTKKENELGICGTRR
jgi:hypothetical protein